jgi:uncharacterized protein YuzE
MAEVTVLYDSARNTLTVWFDEPTQEVEAEETGDEIILMKNKQGQVVGFEKLNFAATATENMRVAFETLNP